MFELKKLIWNSQIVEAVVIKDGLRVAMERDYFSNEFLFGLHQCHELVLSKFSIVVEGFVDNLVYIRFDKKENSK